MQRLQNSIIDLDLYGELKFRGNFIPKKELIPLPCQSNQKNRNKVEMYTQMHLSKRIKLIPLPIFNVENTSCAIGDNESAMMTFLNRLIMKSVVLNCTNRTEMWLVNPF